MWPHASQSGGAGAAEEIEQTGFDLVVCMVREDQSAAAAAAGALGVEGIAEFARGEFEGFFVCGGVFAGLVTGRF